MEVNKTLDPHRLELLLQRKRNNQPLDLDSDMETSP